jgi:molybdopterin converting factor subunit 1
MKVEVRLFAVCRERAGRDRITVELPGTRASVRSLVSVIADSVPELAPLLPRVRVAVDLEFAGPDDELAEGADVALIPPVSGGSGQGPFAVLTRPIALAEVEAAVAHAGAGAVVSFAGTVRERTGEHRVLRLEYEAYAEMAEATLRRIGEEIAARWPAARAAILHRVGALEVGEVSVAIAVASPHRADAFDGCRHAIERLKEDAPIWKREVRADGSVWVGLGS